jgi:hypothetical protein
MRKTAFVRRTLGLGIAAITFLPAACSSVGATQPGELATKGFEDSGMVDVTINYPPEAAPPEAAPVETSTMDVHVEAAPVPPSVSITTGSGGAATAIYFGDNGLVNCGSSATSVPVSITNMGGGTLTWSAAVAAGATYYTLSPLMGTLSSGQTATLQIIPNPIPAVSSVANDLYGGVVAITTNASNDTSHIIQLHQTAHGAIINSTLGAAYPFGGVFVQQMASSQFSLTNAGNVSADVKLAVGSAVFGVVAPGGGSFPFTLGASGTAAPQVTFTPAAAQTYTDTMVMSIVPGDGGAPTPLCGPIPPNVTLTGNGTNNVRISPTNLDFGLINCGATAGVQTLGITANGQGLSYTTSLAKGGNTPFTVTPPTGNIAAQGTAMITITPKPIPFPSTTGANGFGDILTISTDIPGDSPHAVTLNQTARGAILQFAPLAIATHDQASDHYEFFPFSVTNAGNYEGTFRLGDGAAGGAGVVTNIAAPPGTWGSNLVSGNLIGGAAANGTLSIRSATCNDAGLCPYQYRGKITLTIQPNPDMQPTILCADAPPDLLLSVESP